MDDRPAPDICPACARSHPYRGSGREMREASCAVCGASFMGATSFTINWDAKKSQFDVSLLFPRPRGGASDAQLLRDLPGFIVSHSACACGAGLSLENHSIKVAGEEVEFTGIFKCRVCTEHERSALSKFSAAMAGLWSQLTRIKVGPTGVEIEKKSHER